jgi:protein-S-isoprenylcysteine O-methyltransferase Ste14
VKIPSIPQLVLLLFLGGVFIHFLRAAAQVLYSRNMADERGAQIGEFAFLICGTVPVWWLGLFYMQIRLANGIAAAALLVASIALYEWARHTIRGRRFGIGWGDHVPDELCESGPYRFIRHPLYLAYMLAYLAAFVALPHWITLGILAAIIALFTHAAYNDEATIATSPLAVAYADYRERAGLFWPKFSRAAPGRSTP